MSLSEIAFSTCLSDSISWTLYRDHQKEDVLLGICCSFDHLPLNMVEKLLNGVEPRTILSIIEDIDFELEASLFHLGVVMELDIVHQQHYFLLSQLWIRANVAHYLVQHLLEEGSIICSFNYFTAEQSVLSDGCNE
jgi:hypothetical protein